MTAMLPPAHRVTVRQDQDGTWRYKVQGVNWSTIEADHGFARKGTLVRRLARRFPNAEMVVLDD